MKKKKEKINKKKIPKISLTWIEVGFSLFFNNSSSRCALEGGEGMSHLWYSTMGISLSRRGPKASVAKHLRGNKTPRRGEDVQGERVLGVRGRRQATRKASFSILWAYMSQLWTVFVCFNLEQLKHGLTLARDRVKKEDRILKFHWNFWPVLWANRESTNAGKIHRNFSHE